MHLNDCLTLIRDLSSPASKIEQANLAKISFNTIIENCLSNFEAKHPEVANQIDTDDSLWKFGILGLTLLKELNEAVYESNTDKCYLSINDEKNLAQFCQLIVCFTIHYNLENNIGIPIEKLSRYGVNLTKNRSNISPLTRNQRLQQALDLFLVIKNNKREHINLIPVYFYRKYLHEFICALIQSVFSPNRLLEGEKFKKWLNEDLFEETDGANLVSNLIMAQGTCRDPSTLWFTQRIGQLLTKCLLRPNSVMNVIRAVLTEMNAVSTVTLASDWKKCDIVAKILAQCPREVSIEDYFKKISPQLLDLYFAQDIKFSRHFLRVSGSIYSLFAQRYPELTRKFITEKILDDFKIFQSPTIGQKISLADFKTALNKIFLVYVQSTEPNSYALSQIPIELINVLFKTYALLRPRINCDKTKQNLEEFLKISIKLSTEPVNLLNSILNSVIDERFRFNFDYFTDDDENGDQVVIEYPNPDETIILEMVERHSETLVSLINNLNDLKINYMIFLLKKLVTDNKHETKASQQVLLEIEEGISRQAKEINDKILYFTQLSKLFEHIDTDLVIKNYDEIIEFCKILMENLIKLSNVIQEDSDHGELIQLVLSIISVFTQKEIDISYEVKCKLQILLPSLNELKTIYIEMEEVIENLYISIATFTGIKTESKRVLIEEIDDDYTRALRDANDLLIPIKAHGFVELRKLIEKKDEKCLQNIDKIVDLTLRAVKNEDSYLYLSAINCMIALTSYSPKKVLESLIENFMGGKKLSIEDRLKVGEVLTKTIRNFNELVPFYAPKLVNAFLVALKMSDDEVFKSSCLSNLGETCKLLNYSIQDNIYEILECLSSLLDTDRSLQVKRSAVMVLKMIVEGLRKDNFIQVMGSSIVKMYKLLVKVKHTESDDVIRLNCQLTSEYINEMMKNSMFPKQVLEKEIKVLRP